MENYEKHMIKQEISEYEKEGNECFDFLIKNEPINDDYEENEYNFDIIEFDESQYSENQNYNHNNSYNTANSNEEEVDTESIIRRARLAKLNGNIIDFYKEFQFKLECTICNSTESTFASLRVHYKNQHNMRGFAMCCGVKFFYRHLLFDHLCVHKDPHFFKCNKCHRVYQHRQNFNSHLRKNSCTPQYKCDQCGKQFLIQKNLARHKLIHLKSIDQIFNCEKCHTPFESIELLREHENNEDKEKDTSVCKTFKNMDTPSGSDEFFREMQYVMDCNICKIILPDFQALLTHYRLAHNTDGYSMCCGKKFHRPGVLADHLKLHKDPNLFMCQFCNHRFTVRRCLEKHIGLCAKKLKNYKCEKCHTPFESVESLREHEKHIHAGIEEVNMVTPNIVLGGDEDMTPIIKSEAPDDTGVLQDEFIVSEQSNMLKFERKLKQTSEHRDNSEIEEDDNSNEDEEKDTSACKTFRNMYTYSGSDEFFREMQYIMECNLCNIILPDFQSLIAHYRVAHNIVGYGMCCGRKFYRRGVLADHLKLHKDPDLFKCQLCSKRFIARRFFKKHIEICTKQLKK